MGLGDPAPDRWRRPSPYDVRTTLDRLETVVHQFGGIVRVARVDQAHVTAIGGAQVQPVEVLLIENPALVAKLAAVDPELLLDLPIRVLAFHDTDGRVIVTTTPPDRIAAASQHPQVNEVRAAIDSILGGWLDVATSEQPLPPNQADERTTIDG